MSKAASEPSDIVGAILNNKYQVLERLSQGGMGVVYKARHLTLDTPVALKILLKPEEEEAQERFLSEARLASKIRHPNTVYIADFGVLPDGRAFLEMEFLAGRTLATELRKGPIEPARACHIAMQIARGLQAVHEKGIIHRDIKLSPLPSAFSSRWPRGEIGGRNEVGTDQAEESVNQYL